MSIGVPYPRELVGKFEIAIHDTRNPADDEAIVCDLFDSLAQAVAHLRAEGFEFNRKSGLVLRGSELALVWLNGFTVPNHLVWLAFAYA